MQSINTSSSQNKSFIDLSDARQLRNETLNDTQFEQRYKILCLKEEELDDAGEELSPKSQKELQTLSKIFKDYKSNILEGQTVEVARLKSNAPYYYIQFPLSVPSLIKGDQVFDLMQKVPDNMEPLLAEVKSNKELCENNVQTIQKMESGEVQRFTVEQMGVELTNAANLLNIARLASRGFECSDLVVESLLGYQTLIRDTDVTVDKVLLDCIFSVGLHKKALSSLVAKDLDGAIQYMSTSNELASNCCLIIKDRKDQSEDLASKINQAQKQVASNESTISTENKEVVAKRQNFEAISKSLESQKESLAKLIIERKAQEKEMYDRMDAMSNKLFALGIIKAVAEPLTKAGLAAINPAGAVAAEGSSMFAQGVQNFSASLQKELQKGESELDSVKKEMAKNKHLIETKQKQIKDESTKTEKVEELKQEIIKLEAEQAGLNEELSSKSGAFDSLRKELDSQQESLQKQLDAYQDNLSSIQQSKHELEKSQVEVLSNLAETLHRIETSKEQENELGLALDSLHAATVTLARVTNIFDNFIRFWSLQSVLFEQIVTISKTNDSSTKEKLLEKLRESFVRWVALGQINYSAKQEVVGVKEKVHQIQANIPDLKTGHKIAREFSKNAREVIQKEILSLQNK